MKFTLLAAIALFSAPAFAAESVDAHIGQLVDKRMKVLDTSNDGVISKEEYLAAAAKKFADNDKDHDGQLTRDDLIRIKMKELNELNAAPK